MTILAPGGHCSDYNFLEGGQLNVMMQYLYFGKINEIPN
jgi:hypothetical protein